MSVQILQGDNRKTLKEIESGTVQTCVTSPPYWCLRDYGTAKWIGGDPDCDHSQKRGGHGATSKKQVTSAGTQNYHFRGICLKCGAVREDYQLGSETTPEEYVSNLVSVFREVRRVLRDDGTLWLNLGDSYAGSGGAGAWNKDRNGASRGARIGSKHGDSGNTSGVNPPSGLKAKDLVGIPWMVAFALRADGWYLRRDIIWHKSNPMPESATDRPTTAHEYIFLLSKNGHNPLVWRARNTREWSYSPDLTETLTIPDNKGGFVEVPRWKGFDYYYDADAIAEPALGENAKTFRGGAYVNNATFNNGEGGRRTVRGNTRHKNLQPDGQVPNSMHKRRAEGLPDVDYPTRNKRSVWTVATKPYKEAHFATYPPDLILPCILAGSRPGDIVLDPFNGSGTTGAVAVEYGRSYIGCELSQDYIDITSRRLSKVQPYFSEIENAR